MQQRSTFVMGTHRVAALDAPPPARTSRHAVQRLQSRIGNAATARMLAQVAAPQPPAKRRTLQRFNEAEHRALGDLALGARFRLPAGTMFPDLQLTFGGLDRARGLLRGHGRDQAAAQAGARPDKAGQVYYAVLVKIRPKDAAERRRAKETRGGRRRRQARPGQGLSRRGAREGAQGLREDRALDRGRRQGGREAVRASSPAGNIKHFPNPLLGDTTRPTADKVGREPVGSRSARWRATTTTISTRSASR